MATELTLKINGMHCAGCVARVTQALKRVPGVEVQDVEVGSAHVVSQRPGTDRAEIEAAIRKIGFELESQQ
jgi:copper chaperone CopZ